VTSGAGGKKAVLLLFCKKWTSSSFPLDTKAMQAGRIELQFLIKEITEQKDLVPASFI